jgi:hypothetical protein
MDKAVNYQRAVAVSTVALVSTFALLPENGDINYNSSVVPILSAVVFVLLEATPSAGETLDSIARGIAFCWWVWVCYSPMWYHHRYVWWSGVSVFALSVTVMAYNAAAWCVVYDYATVPGLVGRFEDQVYVVLVGLTLCLPHHFCVIHILAKWEVTVRTIAYLLCCWLDLLVVLRGDVPRSTLFWFSTKWWVLYVHTWFLPLVVVVWVQSLARLYAMEVETDKVSDPGTPDESSDLEDLLGPRAQRYMFQTAAEEVIGRKPQSRRAGRLLSSWRGGNQPDVSALVELAGTVTAIDVAAPNNPFDTVSDQ